MGTGFHFGVFKSCVFSFLLSIKKWITIYYLWRKKSFFFSILIPWLLLINFNPISHASQSSSHNPSLSFQWDFFFQLVHVYIILIILFYCFQIIMNNFHHTFCSSCNIVSGEGSDIHTSSLQHIHVVLFLQPFDLAIYMSMEEEQFVHISIFSCNILVHVHVHVRTNMIKIHTPPPTHTHIQAHHFRATQIPVKPV